MENLLGNKGFLTFFQLKLTDRNRLDYARQKEVTKWYQRQILCDRRDVDDL